VPNPSEPYILAPGATVRDDAILPFKLTALDSCGLLSICEFTLDPWEPGPALHSHDAVDEAFFVLAGRLVVQLGTERSLTTTGGFIWVPRTTPHTFANGGEREVRVLAITTPGGIEELFSEQAAHLQDSGGTPDPEVMEEIGRRHGATTRGPPIRAAEAPAHD